MNEIPKVYNAKEVEDKWYASWQEQGLFHANPDPAKEPFCIVIPPPNVTGILHMGHALNNSIQDILARYNRMKGKVSLWMPGTDHAGIATQNVVERSLAKENLKRQDLGRKKFIERVWLWKEEYGQTIIRQLKKLGSSCDWERLRFTMDQDYSDAVKEVFVSLYEKGLIYQGDYIINWCPRCQTALSDEEAPHRQLQGNLYYLKYPLKDSPSDFVSVATTRPETMLGDTAVAVNPKDKRYKKLIGKKLILPLVNREIEIIGDEIVDAQFGTGAVKVTPAHDPNDYAMGKKHNLQFIKVMSPDGRMNENAADYKEMDRFEAREVIIEDLKEKGLLEKIQPHELSAGHCYRCHTIIEPYLSKQWFVKMAPLAKPAIEAVTKGKIKFHPKRWTKVYLNWMENIQDWCISRQIWWGHRIPVYYCRDCLGQNNAAKGVIVSRKQPDNCPRCGSSDIYQDEDVLDTWFSSWLWPFATFYWPFNSLPRDQREQAEKDLGYFYPTAVLVTAPEIIFFWVARMIMSGLEFMHDIPFKDVYIHGTVRDIEGKKMSKSLGNIIDPLEIINEYGTDALRFSLISITAQGQDVYLSKERFEQGRNFANKIWNASRFILMNLDATYIKQDLCVYVKKHELDIVNRWILSRLYSVIKEANKNLDTFKFNEAANLLYGFFWHDFCDWYLELIKTNIKDPHNQLIMYKVLEKFLRVIHPFMPFITEEIWHLLHPAADSIMLQPSPHLQTNLMSKKIEEKMSRVFAAVTAIRNIRTELEIPPASVIDFKIFAPLDTQKLFQSLATHIENVSKNRLMSTGDQTEYVHAPGQFDLVLNEAHIVIPLSGVLDTQKHKNKIDIEIQKTLAEIKAKEDLLSNENFVKRAPQEIVEKEKIKLSELNEKLKKQKEVRDGLQ
ncbi:MAG: valine--tRNA ligase [Candidatus Omnitrophota bacterium]